MQTSPNQLVSIATAASNSTDFNQAISAAALELNAQWDRSPDLVIAYHTETANNPLVSYALNSHFTHSRLIGASSCHGAMTDAGLFGQEQFGVALWAISDPQGCYGVGFSEYGFNVPEATIFALEQALKQANASQPRPALVWMHATPGSEETVIAAINSYFAGKVPIVGGSCADNDIAGHWHCLVNGLSANNAVSIAVMFPSTDIGYSFQSGYAPTEYTGMVTRAKDRTIYEIDHQPAATVYNRWLGGQLDDLLESAEPQNILHRTSLFPLGHVVGQTTSDQHLAPNYLLLHPERITPDKGLSLFANIKEGEDIIMLQGTIASLVNRSGEVIENAQHNASIRSEDIAGGLVIYCAGCMLTVGDEMPKVIAGMRKALCGQPFIGAFTFGEQGCFNGGENRHGNLMISTVVFSRSTKSNTSKSRE